MFRNYIKTAVRNLLRNRIYSLINISGLAIGMACSIIILLWVWDEFSYDNFNENRSDIYRIISDWEKWDWDGLPITPEPLGAAVSESLPEVKNMFRILSFDSGKSVFKYKDKTFYESKGVVVDPSIFTIFSFPFKNSDPKTVLSTPESIVISENFAKKYFGEENPVGKFFEVDGKLRNITGVFNNIPNNSHLQFDFALNIEFLKEYSNYGTDWNAFNFTTYVLLKKNKDRNISSIADKITKVALNNECAQVKSGVKFRIQPLKDIHLYPFGWQPNYSSIGDKTQVHIFTLVAVFILLIACINFMNLSTARSFKRAKEVGMRKTIGANKQQLILQFMGESLLISALSIIIACVLVEAALPAFNELTGKMITTDYTNPVFILGLLSTILFTGIIAGIYPAFFLSSFSAVKIFKKDYKTGKGGHTFRKVLVVFQFTLSIALIFITIIIYKQVDYSKNMKLGYNKENLMYIPLVENMKTQYELAKTELLENPLVKGVTAHRYNIVSDPNPRAAGFNWEGKPENRERDLDLIWSGVDYNFFEMLNIDLVEGRLFSKDFSTDNESVLLNEAAIKEMNLNEPLGKWISLGDWKKTIIGVVKNVHFRSTRQAIEPRVYYLSDFTEAASGIMLIKIDGSKTPDAVAYAEKIWSKINAVSPFEYGFIDEDYNSLYKSETTLGSIFQNFTILAILISCLGLFGLSLFSAEQQRKEIGIRKVLGASVSGIFLLFSKEFTKWVLLANIIAWPVAYYFINNWLQNFAYRIEISWWMFVLSGIIALLIALATVSYQAIKAALVNPVESLKCE